MVETAGKRALRTMDLIPFIVENPACSIRSLAEKFSVSEDQIEKDLQLIFLCGLPGYTPYELIDIVLDNGIVTVIEPQVLDKPRKFSKSEMVVIVLGLRILSELYPADSIQMLKLEKLIAKISALVPIYVSKQTGKSLNSSLLKDINRAINQGLSLDIEYSSVSKDEITKRNILPLELYLLNGSMYLRAVDIAQSAERVFRADSIRIISIGSVVSVQNDSNEEKVSEVSLIVDGSKKLFMERNSSIIKSIEVSKKGFIVNVMISNVEWLKRCILSNSPGITVAAPSDLATQIKKEARAILAMYSSQAN
jgi:proteasome accessory factor C